MLLPLNLLPIYILLSVAQAHYTFPILIYNNTRSNPYQYTRDVTPLPQPKPPGPDYNYKPMLQYNADILTPNRRCGRDAWKPSNGTEIADVAAGAVVGFAVGKDHTSNIQYQIIFHPGPGFAYLAQRPDGVELSQWDDDGDWFKIDYQGPVSEGKWALMNSPEYNWNSSQFYVNCAQMHVFGPGGGTSSAFARFPGTYQVDEPGLSRPEDEEYYEDDVQDNNALGWRRRFLGYQPPGPGVWRG
ncbi:lytic polysaccharide monooxygenase [Lentithecium fluviatile CBS 122367]|uniref:lytic cellulose monooxygenase (C4-dehydrogenating) n=1 Tax=Lentithecium fluviatile CBS 122367 TaxID=1168545 RepID=A0A6G1J873_9PLEO|nr:lytic polysaccharide monooxygenase [Lentithecium fluviatile CBS 122367]